MTAEQFRKILSDLGITQAEAARRLQHRTRFVVHRWCSGIVTISRPNAALIRETFLTPPRRTRKTVLPIKQH